MCDTCGVLERRLDELAEVVRTIRADQADFNERLAWAETIVEEAPKLVTGRLERIEELADRFRAYAEMVAGAPYSP
jgi:hypothetical protein